MNERITLMNEGHVCPGCRELHDGCFYWEDTFPHLSTCSEYQWPEEDKRCGTCRGTGGNHKLSCPHAEVNTGMPLTADARAVIAEFAKRDTGIPDPPTTPASATCVQVGGDHYSSLPISPREYIAGNGLGWDEGNIIKYVTRWKSKNGLEDLRKARHYLDMLIEATESEDSK